MNMLSFSLNELISIRKNMPFRKFIFYQCHSSAMAYSFCLESKKMKSLKLFVSVAFLLTHSIAWSQSGTNGSTNPQNPISSGTAAQPSQNGYQQQPDNTGAVRKNSSGTSRSIQSNPSRSGMNKSTDRTNR